MESQSSLWETLQRVELEVVKKFSNQDCVIVCEQIEEVPGEFTQDDLAEDDVMLLDVWDQVHSCSRCGVDYSGQSEQSLLYT